VDGGFGFGPGGIALKGIGGQQAAQGFRDLAAAGIVHADKGYFRFTAHAWACAFSISALASCFVSTRPLHTTWPSTIRAGVCITPQAAIWAKSVIWPTSWSRPSSSRAALAASSRGWQLAQPPPSTLMASLPVSFCTGSFLPNSFIGLSSLFYNKTNCSR